MKLIVYCESILSVNLVLFLFRRQNTATEISILMTDFPTSGTRFNSSSSKTRSMARMRENRPKLTTTDTRDIQRSIHLDASLVEETHSVPGMTTTTEIENGAVSGDFRSLSWRTPIPSLKRWDRMSSNSITSSIQFISDAGAFTNIEDSSYESISTSAILRYCKNKVLKPYFRLLSIIGWRPLISQTTLFENALWARIINVFYFFLILSLILTGYALQYASCYRQDGYRPYADPVPIKIPTSTDKPVTHHSSSLTMNPGVNSESRPDKNNTTTPPLIHSFFLDPALNVSNLYHSFFPRINEMNHSLSLFF